MAEEFLKSFDSRLTVCSAGTNPSSQVHPKTIVVMKELNFDLSNNTPKHVDYYIDTKFNYVITVCDDAKETCPVFTGKVDNFLHIGFEDPAEAKGSKQQILNQFRIIRDQIKNDLLKFYKTQIQPKL